jgi:hypothetical protein
MSSPPPPEDEPLVVAQRPRESAIVEGNLAEAPVFVLDPQLARPLRNGLRHPDDYVRRVSMPQVRRGELVDKSVTVTASPEYGFPTIFALRCLVAILDIGYKRGANDGIIPVTRHEIAKAVGHSRPSTGLYTDILNQLWAMRTVSVDFREFWWDRANKSRLGTVVARGLIADFRFLDTRRHQKTPLAADGLPHNFVQLPALLLASLRAGYHHGVDLQYLNALRRPLSQRLYVYLAKKDAPWDGQPEGKVRESYQEGLQLLSAKMNLRDTRPSAARRALEPALSALQAPLPVGAAQGRPRRFLKAFRFIEDAQGRPSLVLEFHDEKRAMVEALVERELRKPVSP